MLTLYCLGNPTVKHKNNRHNAGLLLGEFLVDKLELKLKSLRTLNFLILFFLMDKNVKSLYLKVI